ncbi:hypothetical protein COLO4_07319 [Corchorus olitorius]|uniref:Uncharacterized protein n=1 Tax=Corchorus olitorius TaxID=93759 RepID=A0A1R3KK49_9ROSI|nr:hypothetical protein COLO4_07319 [Corchorus olitorius]
MGGIDVNVIGKCQIWIQHKFSSKDESGAARSITMTILMIKLFHGNGCWEGSQVYRIESKAALIIITQAQQIAASWLYAARNRSFIITNKSNQITATQSPKRVEFEVSYSTVDQNDTVRYRLDKFQTDASYEWLWPIHEPFRETSTGKTAKLREKSTGTAEIDRRISGTETRGRGSGGNPLKARKEKKRTISFILVSQS